MRYFIFFFFSLPLFFNPTLKATPNGSEQVNNINGEIYTNTKDQISLSEDSNYLFNFINKHQYFSAQFEQTTLQEKKKRLIEGEIKAHRSGIFKISYFEPLNEVMFSDGKDFYRFDPELEQLNIQPLEELLEETPVGLFTLNLEEIKELFIFSECRKNLNQFSCLLTSKKEESFIKWIDIGVKNNVFDSFKYLDTFGQTISLKFKNVSLKKIPNKEFKLNIPEGTDIVSFRNSNK